MMLSDELLCFIAAHQDDDVNKLILGASRFPTIDVQQAAVQISGRQIAAKKIPLWYANNGVVYPPHLSMEQCSSQATAMYKASLFSGDSFVDLTAGLGVDFFFISRGFTHSHYVERQELLCQLTVHNMSQLGATNVEIHNVDALEYLKAMDHVDVIMIDPARRSSSGGKTVLIADCEPDLTAIEEMMVDKADRVVAKLSPMLDITLALRELKYISQVHVVSVDNECKELLLILEKGADRNSTKINCVNISAKQNGQGNAMQQFSYILQQEPLQRAEIADEMGKYLYEPNSSIMKGGGYKTLSQRYNVRKLAVSTHLYTSDELIEDFPGRKFEVCQVSGFSGRELKTILSGIGKANITIRNFPSTVAELRKKMKIKDGGDIYLFATTLWDDKRVMVKCCKV